MASKELTDLFIKRIKPPVERGKQDEYYDGINGISGFGVRVGVSGKKMFFFTCRIDKKQKRFTIGRYGEDWKLAEAREEAKRLRKLANKGINPRDVVQAERSEQSNQIKFKELAKQYIELYAKKKKKTWKEDESKLNNYFQDWNNRTAESITTDDILDKLIEIKNLALESTEGRQKGGEFAANRNRALILVLFKWAKENRKIKENPCSNPREIPKNSEKDRKRKRTLNDDEIISFWNACGVMGYPFGCLFQLMLVIGRREGTVAGIKWADIDFNKSEWLIYWGDDKSGEPQRVALPKMAMTILEHISKSYRIKDSEYVFTTTGLKPVSGFSYAKKTLDKLSDITQWVLHDLRRTCRTLLPRVGIDRDIAKLTIGHRVEGIDAVYDQYSYYDERKLALSKYAGLLDRIIKGESAKVVMLHE